MKDIFINLSPRNKKRLYAVYFKSLLSMKKVLKLLFLLLMIGMLAGITSSCAIFSSAPNQGLHSFKHKKPLPKKYIINNDYKPIAK